MTRSSVHAGASGQVVNIVAEWLRARDDDLSPVRVDPDGQVRPKAVAMPEHPWVGHLAKIRQRLHVHFYNELEGGPRDPATGAVKYFESSGPCVNVYQCRCGHEVWQSGWVTVA